MIEFQYKKQADDSFLISLKTDFTKIGTFHLMAGVIFDLGWDIISGEIDTIEQQGILYSFDTFILKAPGNDKIRNALEIGFMLDTIFSGQQLTPPPARAQVKETNIAFFREKAELIFQDEPDHHWTIFYVEADSGRGLLYHLSGILEEYKINILKAKIETDKRTLRAQDTFYLQDENGKMFGNTSLAEEVRSKILARLSKKSREI